jgi:hypothetical protein
MTSDTRKDLWDFSDSLSSIGTIESYDWVKDTMHLAREKQAKEPSITPGHQVDFSDSFSSTGTIESYDWVNRPHASRTRKSGKGAYQGASPLHTAKQSGQTEALSPAPSFASHHVPVDDIYDATSALEKARVR